MGASADLPAFVPIPNRDAGAAIAGFVYQVETTVLRWLELGEGEVLELECGEDIDRIGRTVGRGPAHAESRAVRVLEQVKRRTAALTLRSGEARACLAHFHAHRVAHPQLRLSLRYSTTAVIGMERHAGGVGAYETRVGGVSAGNAGAPGLDVWRRLRDGTVAGPDRLAALAAIRRLLRGGGRPAGVSAAHWAAYQQFVAAADKGALQAFVAAVEWSTGSAPEADVAATVHRHLVAAGLAHDTDEARTLRERLIVHVWGVLAGPRPKRLTPEELRREASAGALSPAVRARIKWLYEWHDRLTARVDVLERGVAALAETQAAHGEAQARSDARLAELTREAGIRAAVLAVVAAPSLEPPAIVNPGADRAEAVTSVVSAHGAAWIALHGASGAGKTQLALRVSARLTERPVWIGFRDLGVMEAAARLDAALSRLANRSGASPLTRAELGAVVGQLGAGQVLVLDDLPRYAGDDEFGGRVLALAMACAAAGVRLVTTSVYASPPSVVRRLPAGAVTAVASPPFTTADVQALFAAHGAPSAFMEPAVVSLVTATTRGHPVLVEAFARHLAARGWAATPAAAFVAVFGRQPDDAVNAETLDRVLATAGEPAARQLLFRLALVDGEFGLDEVQALAAVDPPIDQPRARLHAVTGLWVQAESGQRFSVSPLVRDLGPIDVLGETARDCHLALARYLVGRPTIDQLGVLRAVGYFTRAGDSRGAALLLVRALVAAAEASPVRAGRSVASARTPGGYPVYLDVWDDPGADTGVPAELLLYLRAAQVRARGAWGLPTADLEADLERRIEQATDGQAWAVFGAAVIMLNGDVTREGVRRSRRWLQRALTMWPAAAALVRARHLEAPPPVPAGLVWFSVADRWDAAAFREWLALLEAVPPGTRGSTFADDIAHTGALHAAGALVDAQVARDPGDRRWAEVLDALVDMDRTAERVGSEALRAAARCTRLVVLGRHLRDFSAAEREAAAALSQTTAPETRFLINQAMGFAQVDVGDLRGAEPWLRRAALNGSAVFPRLAVRAGLWASVAVGAHDATVAETFAAEAVTAARASLAADDLELVDALAEAGWARWLAGNRAAAYVDWDEAGRHVYDRAAQDGAAAARLVALLGPLTHASIALRRQAGSTSTESSAPIGAPERGTVLRAPHRLSAPLADTVRVALALVLNDVAQGLGRDAAAVEWATAGLPTARGAGDLPTVALLAPSLVPAALEAGQEAPILRDLLTAGRAVAAAGTTSLGRDVSGEAVARAAIRAGDGHGALCGLLPMVLRLAALTVEGSAATPQAGARAAAACRWVAAEGLGTAAGWRAAATLIERGFAPGARAVALTHDADNLGGAAEPFATALRSVAYLAASLDPTLSAVTALRAHLAVLPWLEPELAPFPTLYRATLTRFLTRFWVREADDAGSRFRAPDRVRAALATLAARPPAAFRSVVGDLVVIVSSNLAWAPDALTTRWLGTLPPSA